MANGQNQLLTVQQLSAFQNDACHTLLICTNICHPAFKTYLPAQADDFLRADGRHSPDKGPVVQFRLIGLDEPGHAGEHGGFQGIGRSLPRPGH